MNSLEQISRELVEAREKIVQQQQEIEQLRALAASAVRAQAAAMFQVKQVVGIAKDARAHAALVETALDAERSERLRLSGEMVSINEQVNLLLGTMPTGKMIAHVP